MEIYIIACPLYCVYVRIVYSFWICSLLGGVLWFFDFMVFGAFWGGVVCVEFFQNGEIHLVNDHANDLEAVTSFFLCGFAQDFYFWDADWVKILKSTLGWKMYGY